MKIFRNIALAMLFLWIFQIGLNSIVKNFVLKNVVFSYEDKSKKILEAHQAIYGTIGVLAAKKYGKDPEKGWKDGVLAGEVAYFGKKIARKRGLGLFGQAIHSLGVSMLENSILNKPMFSRYRIFLPPMSFEFDFYRGFRCRPLIGSLLGITANVFGVANVLYFTRPDGVEIVSPLYLGLLVQAILGHPEYLAKEFLTSKKDKFQFVDSLLAGTPIFVFGGQPKTVTIVSFGGVIGTIVLEDPALIDGYTICGAVTVKEDFGALSHEMIHTCQYRETAVISLLIQKGIFKDFLFFSYADLLNWFFEFREIEPEAWDKIDKN